MFRAAWLGGLPLLLLLAPAAPAEHLRGKLKRLNSCLGGHIVDYTHNHGKDRRLWSPALCEKRDLYVYLPPGFDPGKCYPVMLWLHGFLDGEHSLLKFLVEPLDKAIVEGKLPPMIVAAPDGSIKGRATFCGGMSFYINSKAGCYEDYIIQDIWGFLVKNYPIRPEREAHVIAGFSMGGFGSYNLAFKYPHLFKTIIGVCPPLNMRWVDCNCDYWADFDPKSWGWRTQMDRGHEVIGRFAGGLVKIHIRKVIDPLFGLGPQAIQGVIRENPIEMIDRLGVCPGMFEMFIHYGGKDQYNIDAQVESFLYLASCRGLEVTVDYDPNGTHAMPKSNCDLWPKIFEWLAPRLSACDQPAIPGPPLIPEKPVPGPPLIPEKP